MVDGVVYVAGEVEDDAGIVNDYQTLESQGGGGGGSDIWVAQLNGERGDVNWVQQIGTKGDDHLARYGGITANSDSDAIVFGDTTGALY